jgi:hypothetical protein
MIRFGNLIGRSGLAGVMLGAVLAVPVLAQPRALRQPAWSAPQKSQYLDIMKRARGTRAQIGGMGRLAPARITALLGPVRASLEAWASRYHVALKTHKVITAHLEPPGGKSGLPNAATVIKVIDLNGGTLDCDPAGPDGHPCTLVAVDKEGSQLYCVYECPNNQPSEM